MTAVSAGSPRCRWSSRRLTVIARPSLNVSFASSRPSLWTHAFVNRSSPRMCSARTRGAFGPRPRCRMRAPRCVRRSARSNAHAATRRASVANWRPSTNSCAVRALILAERSRSLMRSPYPPAMSSRSPPRWTAGSAAAVAPTAERPSSCSIVRVPTAVASSSSVQRRGACVPGSRSRTSAERLARADRRRGRGRGPGAGPAGRCVGGRVDRWTPPVVHRRRRHPRWAGVVCASARGASGRSRRGGARPRRAQPARGADRFQ